MRTASDKSGSENERVMAWRRIEMPTAVALQEDEIESMFQTLLSKTAGGPPLHDVRQRMDEHEFTPWLFLVLLCAVEIAAFWLLALHTS